MKNKIKYWVWAFKERHMILRHHNALPILLTALVRAQRTGLTCKEAQTVLNEWDKARNSKDKI